MKVLADNKKYMINETTTKYTYWNSGEYEFIIKWSKKNECEIGFSPTVCGDCCGYYDDFVDIKFGDKKDKFIKDSKKAGFNFPLGDLDYGNYTSVSNTDYE